MIIELNVIGITETGETRTVSVSASVEQFNQDDIKNLLDMDNNFIEIMQDEFVSLEVGLKMRMSQEGRPLEAKVVTESVTSFEEKNDLIGNLLMVVGYEIASGEFKAYCL